jgi:hypothetical protein
MDAFFAFLSHLILFLTLSTLLFAVGTYASLALRRRTPARRRRDPGAGQVVLLRRYAGDDHE